MRTVINLDDDACSEVMKIMKISTKTDAVNAALRDVVRRDQLRRLLEATEPIPIVADPEAHYRQHGADIG